jgi:hypothetical protein
MRRVRGGGARLVWRALAALVAAGVPLCVAAADGPMAGDATRPRVEVWVGAQAYRNVWSLYSGSTLALFSGIQEDGARLRVVGGYGEDRYSGQGGSGLTQSFKGTGSFADILLGYHRQLGPLTLKAFAGVAVADRQVTPHDPGAAFIGTEMGGKAVVETWWNHTEWVWTAVDLSWTSLQQTYSARGRLGYRLTPALSIGLEGSAVSNVENDIVGAGAFVRYETAQGEISLAGGVTNDRPWEGAGGLLSAAQASTPIATVSWLTRF